MKSLVNQKYENYELIALDDCSTDNSYDMLKNYNSEKVRIIKGEKRPEGWHGKNWACHQLAKKAKGDIFILLDADIIANNNFLTFC